ncbi:hypothetical protein DCS_05877 [Drechmeria coniospora]|uniref:Uncharacterized protein n=1 Tax=Drechmeria coniospora TaxID=98403 RepID=A0A151GP27_DRECN|nr:hypothetical protein DCS_05877 [Drechmeria coniospora]KYK58859.1 hypothetical protein DCS_05877 [Drechmeria coniospora]
MFGASLIAFVALTYWPGVYGEQYPGKVQEILNGLRSGSTQLIFDSTDEGPHTYEYSQPESPCFMKWASCEWVYFKQRFKLSAATVYNFTVIATDFGSTSSPDYNANTNPSDISRNSAVAKFSLVDSDSTTTGWKISTKVSGGLQGGPAAFNIKVENDRTEEIHGEHTQSTSNTQEEWYTEDCPLGFDCAIRRYLFYVSISGSCNVEPTINCGGEEDACEYLDSYYYKNHPYRLDFKPAFACDQFKYYAGRHCGRRESCTVENVQLVRDGGMPLSHVCFSKTPQQGAHKGEDSCSPITSGHRGTGRRAIRFGS